MIPHDLRALLAACKEAPDDDAPRHVLADWLEDHGQADRAEFVRLSVRLGAGEIAPADEAVSLARLHELYTRNAERWLGGLRELPWRVVFRRGLIEARLSLAEVRRLDSVAPAEVVPWLETLVYEYSRQQGLADLLGVESFRHFTALDATTIKLTAAWVERLGTDPRVGHLRRLRLSLKGSQNPLGGALSRCTQWGGLRALEITEGTGSGSLAGLVSGGWIGRLTSLALWN